jgi:2-C-methyl-D-erythritol 2,4-cyclodiphosphate synthase
MSIRSGIGYDSHRLVAGRPLILGGVELVAERGLEGHSDADALAHALIDAILGAAGLGDIGTHFPDTDERYRDADSLVLLSDTVKLVRAAGFAVVNVDATVVMERPKLGEARAQMRQRLADAIGVPPDAVNVKASTGEGIGFVGREEGVAVLAIATLSREQANDVG